MDTRLKNALKLAQFILVKHDVTHDELHRFAYALLKAFDEYKKTHAH